MSYLKSALFSGNINLSGFEINFLDIGARGDIPPPWNLIEQKIPSSLNIIGFETDPKELKKLSNSFPSRKYYPYGLGCKNEITKFYLNEVESTSSLYPSNEEIVKKFKSKHSQPRKCKKILDLQIKSIDSISLCSKHVSFAKLDVQGAELEILKGGQNYFVNNVVGFTTETWTQEAYKNQPLMHEVIDWAYTNNFEIYGIEESGRWDCSGKTVKLERGIPVCIDLLFFKKIEFFSQNCEDIKSVTSYALILDLWGFTNAALRLLELNRYLHPTNIEEMIKIISKSRKKCIFNKHKLNDILDKLLIKLGIIPKFPPIHY